jgi:AraC family transcriptional regulator, regulatory protein of adaptative response / DNA-3-methyladenine glycosylase II
MIEDFERCYRAVLSRDARFDGWFFVAVTSTGIYCRPSCPAITPKKANIRFYGMAAAAQSGSLRACKRCRPDAVLGSPEWDARADLTGRAMRLISDGVVDREGVSGLARRLCYTERHLHRMLVSEVGAGPLALARARRAHTARLLVETTDLPISQAAFAAGFASIRQFNNTVRAVFAATPTQLRRAREHHAEAAPGFIALRLLYWVPFDVSGLLRFLGDRAVAGVEEFVDGGYRRTLHLPHGVGIVELSDGGDHVRCVFRLEDLRDLGAAVQRSRRLLDLDADPVAVADLLGDDPVLAPLVRRAPGRRFPRDRGRRRARHASGTRPAGLRGGRPNPGWPYGLPARETARRARRRPYAPLPGACCHRGRRSRVTCHARGPALRPARPGSRSC